MRRREKKTKAREIRAGFQRILEQSESDVAATAMVQDDVQSSYRIVTDAINRLPPPFRQIAHLRRKGAHRARVAQYLKQWRGVGAAESRRLWDMTTRALRDALTENNAPNLIAGKKRRRKNPWETSPLPDESAFIF
jgi:hypothetical protein